MGAQVNRTKLYDFPLPRSHLSALLQVIKMARELLGSTVKQISNSRFPDENYVREIVSLCRSFLSASLQPNISFQKNLIQNEFGDFDWTKLDTVILKTGKSYGYCGCVSESSSFKSNDDSQTATQRKRQPRRKAEEAAEERPEEFTQHNSSASKNETAKLISIFEQIKQVSN